MEAHPCGWKDRELLFTGVRVSLSPRRRHDRSGANGYFFYAHGRTRSRIYDDDDDECVRPFRRVRGRAVRYVYDDSGARYEIGTSGTVRGADKKKIILNIYSNPLNPSSRIAS